ncbi:MAG: FkbM family methyltransferase [Deltaproteobacteria bacterium]|nr:FkbM family methyltransferase [Deltaproteobacteria bacterium]
MNYRQWLLKLYRSTYRLSPVKYGLSRIASKLRPFLVSGRGEHEALLRQTRLGSQGKSAAGFLAQLDLRDRIQFMMYARGCHEPATERVFAEKLEKNCCFVDAGANIGYFSLLAASLSPSARIFSFEPLPKNVVALHENIRLNGFTNIAVVEKALGEVSGAAWIEAPDPIRESGWNTIWPVKPENASNNCIVQIMKLDEFLEGARAPTVDFMKIDVEGNELAVLKGARLALEAPGRRQLLVEINEPCLVAQGTSGAEVNDFLLQRGYACFRIRRNGSITPCGAADIKNSDGGNYYYVKR